MMLLINNNCHNSGLQINEQALNASQYILIFWQLHTEDEIISDDHTELEIDLHTNPNEGRIHVQ